MKNIKQYIPILVFVVTLVLSGVTILTSKELEKRKYIPPAPSLATGCAGNASGPNAGCPYDTTNWQYDYASGNWYSQAESPDPSARPGPSGGTQPCEEQGSCVDNGEKAKSGGDCTTNNNQNDCQNWKCTWIPKVCTTSTPTPTSSPSNTPTPTSSLTPTPTRTITLTSTPTVTPTGTLTPTSTPTITPTGTLTPTVSPSPTPPGTFSHNVCVDRSCVSQLCSPATQPCNSTCSGEVDCNSRLVCVNNACKRVVGSGTDECQSDVNCQPLAVTPKVPTSATTTPTILSIIAGAALLLGGILLAL